MQANTNREQWLTERRKTVGASDAPVICGISPWSSSHDLWLTKSGLDAVEETQSMRLGTFLQHGVALEALHQIGGSIISEEPFAIHPFGWASATPDYIFRVGDTNAILEVKVTHERSWDVVPEHYLLQVNWQCWVHGIDTAFIAALHAGSKVQVYEIKPSLQSVWFVDAVAKCNKWHEDHIVLGLEPERKGQQDDDLRKAIRSESGKCVDLDEEIIQCLRRIAEIKRLNAPSTDELTALERQVKTALGSAEVGQYQGRTVVTYKESVTRTFDASKFKTENPDVVQKYMKETVSRRFLVKDVEVKETVDA